MLCQRHGMSRNRKAENGTTLNDVEFYLSNLNGLQSTINYGHFSANGQTPISSENFSHSVLCVRRLAKRMAVEASRQTHVLTVTIKEEIHLHIQNYYNLNGACYSGGNLSISIALHSTMAPHSGFLFMRIHHIELLRSLAFLSFSAWKDSGKYINLPLLVGGNS